MRTLVTYTATAVAWANLVLAAVTALCWAWSYRTFAQASWSNGDHHTALVSVRGRMGWIEFDGWIWDDPLRIHLAAPAWCPDDLPDWVGFRPEKTTDRAGVTLSSGEYVTSARRVPRDHTGWPDTHVWLTVRYRLVTVAHWFVVVASALVGSAAYWIGKWTSAPRASESTTNRTVEAGEA